MATDPILLAGELKPPGVAGANKDIANVMFKLTRELYPGVSSMHSIFLSNAPHTDPAIDGSRSSRCL